MRLTSWLRPVRPTVRHARQHARSRKNHDVAEYTEQLEDRLLLTDVSAAPILQWFEAPYQTIEHRMADVFMAGYGAVWTPPPGRSDSGDQSVGYDVYDRFDVGQPGHPTLYGTQTGLTTLADSMHRAGVALHVDFVMNHNGFSDLSTPGFYAAGGYPGFAITLPTDIDGDFHSAYWGGPEYERLSGLIDIAHEKNYGFIRNPIDPADPRNIRAGTTPAFGRLANIPDPDNVRFYPDIGHQTIYVYDPLTGEQDIPIHRFNLDEPAAGDPTLENAMGYLMRNAQWLVQVIGVDGLRIDAAKHVQGFTLDYLDRAVYRQNPRPLLDGSTQHVFSYSEVFDADPAVLQPHVRHSINPQDPGRIGANRDTLDFKLFFSLKAELDHATQPGWDNWDTARTAWYRVKDAGLDTSPANGLGDTLHNGNAGVTFVQSHDVGGPHALNNVAHALTLMQPGNTVVYFNGQQFGDQRDFPHDSRGDVLSVGAGSDLTRIVNARNTHGRGNYVERWVDDQGLFAFERESSALVLLSNRSDAGFDSRTLSHVGFAPGTYLVELTGNASDPNRDPFDDIPEVIQVYDDHGISKVNVRFPRNTNAHQQSTGGGYAIYGLATPQAPAGLELLNYDAILPGDDTPSNDYENGRQRQTDVYVVNGDRLHVRLQTQEVQLLGSLRDAWADGDNALLKLDAGRPINNLNPHGTPSGVDYDQPGTVTYGFEQFEQKSSPLIGPNGLGDAAWNGNGEFLQEIDLTALEEGTHFLESRAFRHRTDGGPAVFSSFKKVFYVDRLDPDSTVHSFLPWNNQVQENRDLVVRSLDKTADNVHVFLNLPAGQSAAEIMALVAQGQGQASRYDRDLFKYGFHNVPHGNNVATIVTFEPTGRSNIQRVPGLFTSTIIGAGLGDLNHDGQFTVTDVDAFEVVYNSLQSQFNAAGDFNADGLITYVDLLAFGDRLRDVDASEATMAAYHALHSDVFGATDDAYATDEDTQRFVNAPGILNNDRDPGNDGALNLVTSGTVNTTLGGQVVFTADGSIRYDPAPGMQSLGRGQSLTDSVDYTVDDGHGNTDSATISFQVAGLNDPPQLTAPGSFSLNEDSDATVPGISVADVDAGQSRLRMTLDATQCAVTLGSTSGLTFLEGDGLGDARLVFEGTLAQVNSALQELSLRGATNYSGPAQLTIEVDDRSHPGSTDPQTDRQTIDVTISPTNDTPTLDAIDDLTIDENGTPQTISLTGIGAGGGESQPLRVTAVSDSTQLVPHPLVDYNSPNTSGTLTVGSVANASGTALITVRVEDGGQDKMLSTTEDNASVSRVFAVRWNHRPTVDAVPDQVLSENSPARWIELTGIGAGGNEDQPLRVTGISSNPLVLMSPQINYTSPATTAEVRLQPGLNGLGQVTVTITVEDGGPDADLETADDNMSFSRSFTVDVIIPAPVMERPLDTIGEQTPEFQWSSVDCVAARGSDHYELWVRNLTSGQDQVIHEPHLIQNRFLPATALGIGRFAAWARAFDSLNRSGAWSAAGRFRIASAPELISPAVETSDTTPEFTWHAVEGALRYELWVDDVGRRQRQVIHRSDLTVPRFSPTAHLAAGDYRFWVRAFDAEGRPAAWSDPLSFHVRVAPQFTSAAGKTPDPRPQLTWDSVRDADHYELWLRYLTQNQNPYIHQQDLEQTQFAPEADLPIGVYYAWVRGHYADGSATDWSPTHRLHVVTPPQLSHPIGLTDDRTPTLNWNAVVGAQRYEVLAHNRSTGQKAVIHSAHLNSTEFTPDVPLPTGEYIAWSRAWDAGGVAADWSPRHRFTVILPAPTPLSPLGRVSGRSVVFEWTSVEDAVRYELRVRNNSTKQDNVISRSNLTTTRYVHSQRLLAGSYLVWFRAFDQHDIPGTWAGAAFQVAASQTKWQPQAADRVSTANGLLDDHRPLEGVVALHGQRSRQSGARIGELAALSSESDNREAVPTISDSPAVIPNARRSPQTHRDTRAPADAGGSEAARAAVFVAWPAMTWAEETQHPPRDRSAAVPPTNPNRDDE